MKTPDISLRAPTPADLPALRLIRNDPAAQAILMGHPETRTGDDTERWIERRAADTTGSFHVIARDDVCVGFAQLTGRHGIDRHAHFGIALSATVRGAGVGTAAMHALQEHAAAQGLRKLMCEVREDNEPALRLYERLGFRAVGTLRAHYDDGDRRWDVVVMEKLLDGKSDA